MPRHAKLCTLASIQSQHEIPEMLEKVEQTVEDIDAPLKESTRPIRALNRGLEVLIELNRLQRAAINTLAIAAGLPRTTTYRVLETLRMAGYVQRDRNDDCYVPTIMVRALSGGFDEEATVASGRNRCSRRCAGTSSGR